ncbi:hypothetical protein RN001_002055 [Aquatica leii]|uniref:15-hydroxyprostaglandin dehydrogenase [NAD(+)]-like n=1 Tax=Aquatica leii TaxID=1421715 RepID=A0AAN7Q4U3_9COLE|nr:hypothetical protein RN001_002055 [Aquatica leii]
MAYYIKEKVAIVTGGASDIGLCCVKQLLQNGLKAVTIADINETKGQEAINKLSKEFGADKAIFIKTDVTKPDEFEELFKITLKTWKSIDVVINHAGILNDKQWETEILVNCSAVVRGSLLAMQYMGKDKGGNGGIIINISSVLGFHPLASCPVHVATKHFIIGFNRSLGSAYHYRTTAVKVITLCSGLIDTLHLKEAAKNAITGLNPDIGELLSEELQALPSQPPEAVGKALILVIAKGDNGSVWVTENNQPVYEVVRTLKSV